MELGRAYVAMQFWLAVEYAGALLRESDLEDIAHYFVYTADEWAALYLGVA